MHDLVRVIFRRLETLDPEATPEEEEEGPATAGNTELRMNVSPTREATIQSLDQVLETPTAGSLLETPMAPPQREKSPAPAVHDGELHILPLNLHLPNAL